MTYRIYNFAKNAKNAKNAKILHDDYHFCKNAKLINQWLSLFLQQWLSIFCTINLHNFYTQSYNIFLYDPFQTFIQYLYTIYIAGGGKFNSIFFVWSLSNFCVLSSSPINVRNKRYSLHRSCQLWLWFKNPYIMLYNQFWFTSIINNLLF